mgnify:CR=1 FL=1
MSSENKNEMDEKFIERSMRVNQAKTQCFLF